MSIKAARLLVSIAPSMASITIVGGVVVLIGWIFGAFQLVSFHPESVAMSAITALTFALSGACLWLLRVEAKAANRGLGAFLGGFIFIIGLVGLVLGLSGWARPIPDIRGPGGVYPTAMSPYTGVGFILVGGALLALARKLPASSISQSLSLLAASLSFVVLLGYLYHAAPLTEVSAVFPMALNTAIMLLLLSIGIAFARPHDGLITVLTGPGSGSRLMRRLLPTFILLPVLLGWARLIATDYGGLSEGLGVALMVTFLSAGTIAYSGWNAIAINREEAERHRADAANQRREQEFHALVNNAPDIIARFDREFRHVFVNPVIEELTGIPVERFINKTNEQLGMPRDLVQSWNSRLNMVFETGMPSLFEFAYETPKGVRFFQSRLVPEHGPDGTVVDVLGITRDITEQKAFQAALQESEQRFRLLADTAPVMIWMAGKDALCTFVNRPWLEFRGRSLEQELGTGWLEGVYPDDYPVLMNTYHTSFEARSEFRMEYRLQRHDGEYRWISDSGVPFFSPANEFVGYVGSAIDITEKQTLVQELQAINRQLQDLDRLKSNLISTVSHELRTPLASIMGYAEFLEDRIGGPLTDEQDGYVDQIQKSAYRLQHLVDDLLDVARLESGSFKLSCQEVDLKQKILEVVQSLLPQAQEASVTMDTELPSIDVSLLMDPARIAQVLTNLVSNALKFTGPGGLVTIAVYPLQGEVRVEVRDTGVGIDPQHLPYLFQKFYQVDPSDTRAKGGAGLGLAISRALVEAHGGQIGVESKGLGQGSTFWFTLPL